eukprot:8476636-Pyramimonas_sp.AAC.1
MLGICGGTVGISHLAFKRMLTAGGNTDALPNADSGYVGSPRVQQVLEHHLHTCYVTTLVLHPGCRITG